MQTRSTPVAGSTRHQITETGCDDLLSMRPGHEPTTRRIRKPRGQGLRTRTGCLTCRRRHVKCDEAKPNCLACTKIAQVCSYESEEVPSRGRRLSVAKSNLRSVVSVQVCQNQSVEADLSREELRSTYCTQTLPAWRPPSIQNERYSAVDSISRTSPLMETLMQSPKSAGPTAVLPRSIPVQVPVPSPRSPLEVWTVGSVSSTGNAEADTAGWFGLLFADAVLGNSSLPDINFEAEGLNIFGNSIPQTPTQTPSDDPAQRLGSPLTAHSPHETSNKFLLERVPRLGRDQLFEKQSWHSSEPIKLLPEEQFLFQHFVRHISLWIDFFDPKTPFSTFVPHLAIHNVGLLNAILALSARHLPLRATTIGAYEPGFYGDPVQYYYKTLHYIQKAMQYNTYTTSLELLSTALIVSTYEMLDGSTKDWERHLKGVFWIQRSQVIHGDSKGLRSAVWWAWLCQDVWAAFREKRKPFTFWKPMRTFEALDPHELASRSVYLFAQMVGYCSQGAIAEDGDDLSSRATKASDLWEKLEEWRTYLTIEFEPMPLREHLSPSQYTDENVFEPVWIHPPSFAVAVQLYNCSHILLLTHRPLVGGFEVYMRRRGNLMRCIDMVCGIAMTLKDHASSVMCSQCVFIAGLALEDGKKRESVLDILKECRQLAGWPAQPLEDELILAWKESDQA